MYPDYKQIQSKIDSFRVEGEPRVRAEWLWMETQDAGRLEKRKEGDVEVEYFTVTSADNFLKATRVLQGYFKWRYEQK